MFIWKSKEEKKTDLKNTFYVLS